jgi:hypothetical protein
LALIGNGKGFAYTQYVRNLTTFVCTAWGLPMGIGARCPMSGTWLRSQGPELTNKSGAGAAVACFAITTRSKSSIRFNRAEGKDYHRARAWPLVVLETSPCSRHTVQQHTSISMYIPPIHSLSLTVCLGCDQKPLGLSRSA